MKVDLADPLQRTEGERGGAGLGGLRVDLGLVPHPQHQRLLEQDPEGVDVVAGEVEHDPPRHERVARVSNSGEQGEPDSHTRCSTVQPAI